jgi:hypothetical protein
MNMILHVSSFVVIFIVTIVNQNDKMPKEQSKPNHTKMNAKESKFTVIIPKDCDAIMNLSVDKPCTFIAGNHKLVLYPGKDYLGIAFPNNLISDKLIIQSGHGDFEYSYIRVDLPDFVEKYEAEYEYECDGLKVNIVKGTIEE